MLTSRGWLPARRLMSIEPATSRHFYARKLGWSVDEGKSGYKFRKCGLPLPFRAQSVEKLGENYQQPKNMSTRLT
jgi:hypothetical protein